MSQWKYDPDTLGVNIGSKKLRFVNRVHPTKSREKEAEERAQIGQLAAAAPELLAALKAMADHFGPLEDNHLLHDGVRHAFALSRAAISKAEGGSE